jgi:hypothetical protein
MRLRLLRPANIALFVICVLAIGHVIYLWDQLRPRVVMLSGVECGDFLEEQAHYLALICQAVINAKGPLPADPAEAGRIIADNAAKLRFSWPSEYKIGMDGEICDCAGNPFQILVSADRVAITSASLYGFYFADLKKPNVTKHDQ